MNSPGSFNIILLTGAFVLFFSCQPPVQEPGPSKTDQIKENLIKINRYLVSKDSAFIEKLIAEKKWQMKKTPAGLWYEIDPRGHGEKITAGKEVTIAYRITLPDGTLCYSSDSLGLKKFVAGKGDVESGLEQGILLMRKGDRARFILPPHLAYGLTGDQNKIGPRTIIIYEVEVLEVK